VSGVKIVLTDEHDAAIGRADTDAAGNATIYVTNSGAPGAGTWVLRAAGDDTWYGAETRVEVTRTAVATLSAKQSTVRIWEQTGTNALVVDAACRFPVSGAVELWLGGRKLGAAPIVDNSAALPFDASSVAKQGGKAEVRLNPTNEHIVASPIAITIDTRPRQAVRTLGIVGGIVVLGVLAFGRSAALRRRLQRAWRKRPRPVGGLPGRATWGRTAAAPRYSGRVVDAYSGRPIAGARIRSINVTFSDEPQTESVLSSHAGEFEVCPGPHQPHRWEIAATGYRPREVVSSELGRVALTQRKHALLEDLVGWARVVGAPFDQKPEATPGHIARVARQVGNTAAWAREVESAAFSAASVDEARDEEVRSRAPRAIPAADDPGEDVR
jgi:hypothetical protein